MNQEKQLSKERSENLLPTDTFLEQNSVEFQMLKISNLVTYYLYKEEIEAACRRRK